MKTPFDNLTWTALLYLWTATEPFDIADSLTRECRSSIRKEIAAALWQKAKAWKGIGGPSHAAGILKTFNVEEQ